MARGTKTTDFLKECMADALLKLMKDRDIDNSLRSGGVGQKNGT